MNPRQSPVYPPVKGEPHRLPTGSVWSGDLTENRTKKAARNLAAIPPNTLPGCGQPGPGDETRLMIRRKISGAQNKLQGKTSLRMTH
jgi:hypothetical protein